MGASLSSLTEASNGSPGLGDIPESCVARVFLHLSPPEICNLARLNRAFRGAASSDPVWESKLPANYRDLLGLLPPERHRDLCKKDIYALLSRPVPFDDGNKACCSFTFCLTSAIRVGEFIVGESDPATEVRFSMKQIDCTHSKGGLCVDTVSIIPSDLKARRRRGVMDVALVLLETSDPPQSTPPIGA
ncbi:hypothetical protein RJ639_026283 [Escallonia herrerae]|uniref:F-box domain-containing protein n=2 Tax=Escallonia herrerae TaxID=1293975 RepID=A0AA88RV91_9ASTE|nr:hypothetical protein RJ639_026283 [Escallonia herrerae]